MTATLPPPPAPPVIERPAPFQASYGLVSGRAAPGATRVVVKVDGRIAGKRTLAGRAFTLDVPLPLREVSVRVETVDRRGRRAGRTVHHVLGLPRAARPRLRAPRLDEALQQRVRRLAAAFPGASGIYVENLATGQAAAWNARATFPAASTLKLAIAVTYLARAGGRAGAGQLLRPPPAVDAPRVRQRGGELDARLARRLDERRRQPRQLADAVDRARAHRDVRRLPDRHGPRPRPRAGGPRCPADRRRPARLGSREGDDRR